MKNRERLVLIGVLIAFAGVLAGNSIRTTWSDLRQVVAQVKKDRWAQISRDRTPLRSETGDDDRDLRGSGSRIGYDSLAQINPNLIGFEEQLRLRQIEREMEPTFGQIYDAAFGSVGLTRAMIRHINRRLQERITDDAAFLLSETELNQLNGGVAAGMGGRVCRRDQYNRRVPDSRAASSSQTCSRSGGRRGLPDPLPLGLGRID